MNDPWQRTWKEAVMASMRCYPSNFLDEGRETTKTVDGDI
jgi:hypothetical protein